MPLFDTSKCLPLLHSNRNGSIRWWAVVTANAIYLPMSFKTLKKFLVNFLGLTFTIKGMALHIAQNNALVDTCKSNYVPIYFFELR